MKKSIRKKIMILLFILLNVAVILLTALNEFAGHENAAKFRDVKVNILLLVPAFGCFSVAIFAESVKYSMIMKSISGKGNLKTAFKTVILGRYYDNITPFGAGGQPFQIYFLSQNGYPSSVASVVPIAGFVFTQFGFMLLASVAFIFGGIFRSYLSSEIGSFVKITAYVGLVAYSSVPILIMIFTNFPKAASKIIVGVAALLHKFHIIKDRKRAVVKIYRKISEYSKGTRGVVKSKLMCFKMMVLSVIYQLALCSIPFFLLIAFGGKVGYIESVVTTISIYCVIIIFPTPGNAGAAEGSFYAVFSALSEGLVFWAMLFWRFFCFYIFIIAGGYIYLKKYIDSKRKTP